jgi:hypothetical protein
MRTTNMKRETEESQDTNFMMKAMFETIIKTSHHLIQVSYRKLTNKRDVTYHPKQISRGVGCSKPTLLITI